MAIATAGRDEALAWVRENVAARDVVLVKASRGAALEASPTDCSEEGHRAPEVEVQQP